MQGLEVERHRGIAKYTKIQINVSLRSFFETNSHKMTDQVGQIQTVVKPIVCSLPLWRSFQKLRFNDRKASSDHCWVSRDRADP